MEKTHELWAVKKLVNNLDKIEFPEFQREPTVWDLEKKQRLIDSILRGFDISLIYFAKKAGGGYDCIDGRQRINAILSYLGINDSDEDNEFHLKMTNEIYDDEGSFKDVDKKRYETLGHEWKNKINNFDLNIVIITEVADQEELNLLFLRLQLGSVLNAGERLHAMTGEMRDFIFYDLSKHKFFSLLKIPERRYAKEQVAAQIVLNYYSKQLEDSFHRSRYVDLQDFFKQRSTFTPEDKKLTKEIRERLNSIVKRFGNELTLINNRAIAVSVFVFISQLINDGKENKVGTFKEFFIQFLKTIKWQIPRGVQMDEAYWDLLKFQTSVTQAAGEKGAIQKRHDLWREYFYFYEKEGLIKGDKEFKKRTGKDPNKERAKIVL